jgi:hypothetical protein
MATELAARDHARQPNAAARPHAASGQVPSMLACRRGQLRPGDRERLIDLVDRLETLSHLRELTPLLAE